MRSGPETHVAPSGPTQQAPRQTSWHRIALKEVVHDAGRVGENHRQREHSQGKRPYATEALQQDSTWKLWENDHYEYADNHDAWHQPRVDELCQSRGNGFEKITHRRGTVSPGRRPSHPAAAKAKDRGGDPGEG